MKKVYPVIAVLMALALFSCDFVPTGPVSEPVEYTEDGRALVNLTIGRPNMSKALTAELAKAGVDFYEVAFKDPAPGTPKYYRASWDYTQTGKIKVPAGDYAGADNAILFAGRYSDMTLLAVARITHVDTSPITTTATISITTTSVTFTLVPLTTNVNGAIQTGPTTFSSFHITGPTDYETRVEYSTERLPSAKIDSKNIPIFVIPHDVNATANFELSLGTATFTDFNIGIIVAAAGKVHVAGVTPYDDDTPPVLLNTTPVTGTRITAPAGGGGTLPTDIELLLVPPTPPVNGVCKIAIEQPVIALGTTESPHTWYVRGGLNNGLYDLGATAQSTGGAILIGIGAVTDGIVINTLPPTP